MARYKHITAKPTDGGQLFTALSHEFAGPANYVQKLDWRRDLDQEVRREGYDYFSPSGLSVYPKYTRDHSGYIYLKLGWGE